MTTATEQSEPGPHDSHFERIAVVGGGFMGSGIVQSTALAGLPVTVFEQDADRRAGIVPKIKRALEKPGRLSAEEVEAAVGRITTATAIEEIADADLVIEAVPEVLELKLDVVSRIEPLVSVEATIASNTSSIPIAELAGRLEHPERMVGLHFFAPVPVMKLVEVVSALDSSADAIADAHDFCQRIGKQSIETKDRSGFVVNLLLVPYLMAAVRMYEEEFATPEDIDLGMKLGCGHPMGPLTLCDFIGLDVLYNVCDSLYEEFKRDEYAPPPVLKRMVASGRLGRKSGRGFYDYEAGVRS